MASIHFQHKEFIWLLSGVVILVVLYILLLQWKAVTRKKIGDSRLVNLLTGSFSARLFNSRFILFSAAFVLGVVAAMNPRSPGGRENISRKGIDVAIALDVSKSMLAADMAPSRLQRARQLINRLMDEMPEDRIALVLFAGKAYLQMPLTTDHGAAKLFVNSAGPSTVPQQGTVISDALKMSARAFNRDDRRYKAVILISDGEDHDPEALGTAKALTSEGIMINTVGIGSPEGATITDPMTGELKKDQEGNTVVSRLNEAELKNLADATNGVYSRLSGTDETVTLLKSHLAQIERKAFGDESFMSFRTYYFWFAGIMLALLLAEFFMPERKKEIHEKKA